MLYHNERKWLGGDVWRRFGARYDFNDDLILVGGSFWVRLAQTLLR